MLLKILSICKSLSRIIGYALVTYEVMFWQNRNALNIKIWFGQLRVLDSRASIGSSWKYCRINLGRLLMILQKSMYNSGVLHDDNYRWGIFTTNVSESHNNILYGVSQMSIKAYIELTFHRTMKMFNKNIELAVYYREPFPPKLWKRFKRLTKRLQHIKL